MVAGLKPSGIKNIFARFLWISTFHDLSWFVEIKLDEYMGLVMGEVVVFINWIASIKYQGCRAHSSGRGEKWMHMDMDMKTIYRWSSKGHVNCLHQLPLCNVCRNDINHKMQLWRQKTHHTKLIIRPSGSNLDYYRRSVSPCESLLWRPSEMKIHSLPSISPPPHKHNVGNKTTRVTWHILILVSLDIIGLKFQTMTNACGCYVIF